MMFNRGLHGRVDGIEKRQETLETAVDGLRGDVGGLVSAIGDQHGMIREVIDGLAKTKEDGLTRGATIEDRVRGWWSNGLKTIIGVMALLVTIYGAIYTTVSGFTGAERAKTEQLGEKVGALSDALTGKVSGLGEVASRQGADVGTLKERADIQRERGEERDAELRQHDQDLAFMKGVAAAKGWPHP